jgi:hypothetical protein
MSSAQSGQAQVITNGVMTGTTVLKSKATAIRGMKFNSYSMHWTGTPTGSFAFYASNKAGGPNGEPPSVDTDADWALLTLSLAPTNPSGAAGQTGLDLNEIGYGFIHMRYTNASGTGTLQVYFHGKG